MNDIDLLIQQFLDERDAVTDADLARIVSAVEARPALGELLKEQLVLDELLAQQFLGDQQDFVNRVESRLTRGSESPSSKAQTQTPRFPPPPPPMAPPNKSADPVSAAEQSPESSNRPSTVASPPPSTTQVQTGENSVAPAAVKERRLLIAVSCALVLTIAGLLWLQEQPVARKIAVVETVQGTVLLQRDGQGIRVAAGQLILAGDDIEVLAEARTVVRYLDGTTIQLSAASRARFEQVSGEASRKPNAVTGLFASKVIGKQVTLETGELLADVQPQRGLLPMRFQTATANVTVVGTRLQVQADTTGSRVSVSSGTVTVQPQSVQNSPDKAARTVVAGQTAVVSETEFEVLSGDWPGNRDGLILVLSPAAEQTWDAKNGARILARSAAKAPLVFRPRGPARLAEDGRVELLGGALLAENSVSDAFVNACRESNQFSLELTLQPETKHQFGPARLLTCSRNSGVYNVSLVQDDDWLKLRVTTGLTRSAPHREEFDLVQLADAESHHCVVTFADGKVRAFLDGQPVSEHSTKDASLSAWQEQPLLLGDDWDGDRHWNGHLHGIALYSRALTAAEVRTNALHYPLQFFSPAAGQN